jgi:hypothetical protein
MFILEPNRVSSALARKRVQVREYPDGRIEIRHEGNALPYRVFDKMRQVNQAAVVDNKHLDAALEMARLMQATRPHHRQRNNSEPARSSQSYGMFAKPAKAKMPKDKGRPRGRQPLKRGDRLPNEELIARGLAEYVS